MNTRLLRIIHHKSLSHAVWLVPGYDHAIIYHRSHSIWRVPGVSWPAIVDGRHIRRSARLDWHRSMIKNELRALLKQVAKMPEII